MTLDCKQCGRTLPDDAFYIRKSTGKPRRPCKDCVHKRTREWHKKNPDAVRRHGLKRRYGISEQDFNSILERQGGGCAICGVTDIKFHVDHDHDTGKVRGILCENCNRGLGMFRDSHQALTVAAEYVK